MKAHFLTLIISAILLISLNDAKKKKKKSEDPLAEDKPKEKKPLKTTSELFCDACTAILKEAMKELRGKKKESDVYDVLENVCDPEKYYTYNHPPPEMKEGCEAFIAVWDEEVTKVLINRPDDEYPIRKLCYEISEACVGVDMKNVKRMDDEFMMDGQPIKFVLNFIVMSI